MNDGVTPGAAFLCAIPGRVAGKECNMPANVEGMVREAIRAVKAGNKAEARALLEKATEINQYNEQAWMWLSAAVDTVEEQILCLENVLYINPDNVNAQRGLDKLRHQNGTPPPAVEPKPEEHLFGPAPTTEEPLFGTESHHDRPLFEPDPPADSGAPAFADFDLDGIDSLPAFDDARSLFADDDSPDSASAESELQPLGDELSFEEAADDDDYTLDISLDERVGGSPVFTADVDDMFGEDLFSDDDFSSEAIPEPEKDLEDMFAESADEAPAPAGSTPAFSGGVDHISEDEAPPDFHEAVSAVQAAASNTPSAFERAFEEELAEAVDETTRYFNMIPAEIKATRMPGIDEQYPRALIIALVMLIVLNLLALGFLLLNLA
jgi:hypothetical protein